MLICSRWALKWQKTIRHKFILELWTLWFNSSVLDPASSDFRSLFDLFNTKELSFFRKFLNPISLQSDGTNLCHFKLKLFDHRYRIHSLISQRSTTLGCKGIGRKSEFVAKTRFLCHFSHFFVVERVLHRKVSRDNFVSRESKNSDKLKTNKPNASCPG